MKTKITILGSGSSIGVPRIDGYWGNCNRNNKKNIRTRCSIMIKKGNNSILIDSSPDIRNQFLSNKINNLSYVLYTHPHADQLHGINELRPFYWKNKKKIKIFSDRSTIKYIKEKFNYCFEPVKGYVPFLDANTIKNSSITFGEKSEKIIFSTINLNHGKISSLGYIFEKVAYFSDCNGINKKYFKQLINLKCLIIDCLKIQKHPSHFSLNEALEIANKLNIIGTSDYVRVSELKKQAVQKLIDNVDHSQVLDVV